GAGDFDSSRQDQLAVNPKRLHHRDVDFVGEPLLCAIEVVVSAKDLRIAGVALHELLGAGLQLQLSPRIRFFLCELLNWGLDCRLWLAAIGLLRKSVCVGIGVGWRDLRLIYWWRAIGSVGKCIGRC